MVSLRQISVICLLLGVSRVRGQRAEATATNLTVTSVLIEPFLTKSNGSGYVGYIKDLLDEISKASGLGFTLTIREDGSYVGMVQDLIDMKVDVAAGPLTITQEREQKVDMTKPFMSTGITVLMKKTDAIVDFVPPVHVSTVLKVFEPVVWVCILLVASLTTVCFYVINRFNPNEKPSSKTDEGQKEEGEPEKNFGILACIWMVLGGLTLQGYTKRPQSVAALILFFVWWVLCLVVFAFYIGGIQRSGIFNAAVGKMIKFTDLESIVKQDDIAYGTLKDGSTSFFFKHSNIGIYQQMHQQMEGHPTRMVSTVEEGVKMVRMGKYALLAESSIVDYWTGKKPCDIMQVGGLLNSIGYGLGLPQGSPHKNTINQAILSLQESQTLQELYNKWWYKDCSKVELSKTEDDVKMSPPSRPLTMGSIGGVFIIYLVGVLVAMLVMLVEIFCHRRSHGKESGKTNAGKKEDHEAAA